MVKESEGNSNRPELNTLLIKTTGTVPEIDYRLLYNPFQQGIVDSNLMSNGIARQKLEDGLREYELYVSGLSPGEDLKKYAALLQPVLYFQPVSGEKGEISLMSGMHSLELLKNSILTVEAFSLSVIANH